VDVELLRDLADGRSFQAFLDQDIVISFEDFRLAERGVLIFSGFHRQWGEDDY
jgi:hypothetical protein